MEEMPLKQYQYSTNVHHPIAGKVLYIGTGEPEHLLEFFG